ncbi:MAG: heparan-alpha-glucosaminide N-acetyltransferase domain-containing protein [Candidatus Micrarchaeota archaeon]
MRVRAIDAFRGTAIVLMVFFSLAFNLSAELPDFLKHNQPNEISPGDFVLPMFLFASGMSLVFFVKKREKAGTAGYLMDIIGRSGKLAIIWIFLSPFSSGTMFGMDELALSLILSVVSLLLIDLPDYWIAAAALAPAAAYLALGYAGVLPDFPSYYLGGFAAAPFYLPVMLAGIIAGKSLNGVWKIAVAALIIGLVLTFFVPPYKSGVSPSFIALSIAVSAFAYMVIERLGLHALEYPGKKPLEFWILMYVLLIIPLVFYAIATKSGLPLDMPWPAALGISVVCIPILIAASKALGYIAARILPHPSVLRVKP